MSFATLRDVKGNKKSFIQHDEPIPSPIIIKQQKDVYTYDLPSSILVKTAKLDGRGVYANEVITAGCTILKKTPYVHAISTRFLHLYCSNCCHQTSDLHRCTKCKRVYYCNTACQNKDWVLHKFECKSLQELSKADGLVNEAEKDNAIPGEAIRCLARILWQKSLSKTCETKEVELMQSNRTSIQPTAYEAHTHLAHGLMHYIGVASASELQEKFNIASAGQLVDLISQFTINTFSLASSALFPFGVAVSPIIALFNHSCEPNAAVVFPRSGSNSTEPEMRVVVTQEIRSGDQITAAYLDVSAPREVRRQELKERYGFECMCNLCERDWESAYQVDPREAMWCPKKCGGMCKLPTDELKTTTCVKCKTLLSSSTIDVEGVVDAIRVGREGLEKADMLQDTDPSHALKLTSNLIPLLVSGGVCGSAHPLLALHRLQLSLLLSASQTTFSPENLDDAEHHQQRLDDQVRTAAETVYGLSSIHPFGHPARGIALSELGKVLLVDEPLPLTHKSMANSRFPPHGESRLRLAHETLVRSLKELQIGFGFEADGGEVGKQVRKWIVDVERELTVWIRKAGRGAPGSAEIRKT